MNRRPPLTILSLLQVDGRRYMLTRFEQIPGAIYPS
jgi:hypothetical protein